MINTDFCNVIEQWHTQNHLSQAVYPHTKWPQSFELFVFYRFLINLSSPSLPPPPPSFSPSLTAASLGPAFTPLNLWVLTFYELENQKFTYEEKKKKIYLWGTK